MIPFTSSGGPLRVRLRPPEASSAVEEEPGHSLRCVALEPRVVELEKLIGGPVRWPPAADAAAVIDLDGRRPVTARRRTPSSSGAAADADQLRFPLA